MAKTGVLPILAIISTIALVVAMCGLCEAAQPQEANEYYGSSDDGWHEDNWGYEHHHRHAERLVNPPQPRCDPLQGICALGNNNCCQGQCNINFIGATLCCQPNQGDDCQRDLDCCSTRCDATKKCTSPPCFSGDTLVRVEGQPGLVAIKNVRTGQRVQCMRTSDDMRVPLDAAYCEVMNWYHAESATYTQRRISFTRPNGVKGSITLSANHMMAKLMSAAPGTTAATFDAFGSFTTLGAGLIRAGDVIAVLTDQSDAAKGLTATRVEAAEAVDADGMFTPAINYPYIVADGVVAPVWNINRDPVANIPAGASDGADSALKHYKVAPIFMVRMQPLDTAGVNSTWGDGRATWPGVRDIRSAARPHIDAGQAYNWAAMRDWFTRRYAEWRADASAGVTLAEITALISSDAVWTAPDEREACRP